MKSQESVKGLSVLLILLFLCHSIKHFSSSRLRLDGEGQLAERVEKVERGLSRLALKKRKKGGVPEEEGASLRPSEDFYYSPLPSHVSPSACQLNKSQVYCDPPAAAVAVFCCPLLFMLNDDDDDDDDSRILELRVP